MREFPEDDVKRLYYFALRLTRDHHAAEDLTQETILRAWRHRRRLRDPGAIRTWLFRVAANAWSDQTRRGPLRPERSSHVVERSSAATRPADEEASRREEVQKVVQAMDLLPDRQRQVLWLHAVEGLSHQEIAETLGIHSNTVKVNLFHARRAMRRKFNDIAAAD